MNVLSLLSLSLIPTVFGGRSKYYKSPPCDCFDVSLADGYPQPGSSGEICYKYTIRKTGYYKKCRASLQYFVLDAGDLSECDLSLSDLNRADIVTSADDINDVFAPFSGYGSETSGVKISQTCDDDPESFTICFDDTQVGGTQAQGLIGLKDSNGANDACTVYATVPDFCGGIEPTEEPSPSPTTAEPTTGEPTSSPTCIDNLEDPGFSCECFNFDPDPVNNCPRIDCVFDLGGDGCTDLPSGGAGNIPGGNPIQCDLNASPDECVDVNGEECTNSPNSNTGCTPDQANDFGCCKTPPVAVDDSESTEEPNSVTVNVLANDIELDGDTLTIVGNTPATNGGTVEQPIFDNTVFTYTPSADGCDDVAPDDDYQDTFTYTISDDDGNESTATVTITVICERERPVANEDTLTIFEGPNEGDGLPCDVPINVLANDVDPDGEIGEDLEVLDITDSPSPNIGSVTILADGSDILYCPDEDLCDDNKDQDTITDTFRYRVRDVDDDKLTSNDALVTVEIVCSRVAPEAFDDFVTVDEGDEDVSTDPLNSSDQGFDSDPDDFDSDVRINQILEGPSEGTAEIVGGGLDILYTPDPNVCRDNQGQDEVEDEIVYNVRDPVDDDLVSDSATIFITIICDRRGPVAVNDEEEVEEGDSVQLTLCDNDYDSENGPSATGQGISLQSVEDPSTPGASVVIRTGCTIEYTAAPNECFEISGDSYVDSFNYVIVDDDDGETDEGTVSITVLCERATPIARDDSITIEETDSNVPLNVLPNDTDPDDFDDDLTVITIVDEPDLGIAVVTDDGKDILYTPNDDACDNNGGGQVVDTLEYTVIDALDDGRTSAPATVTITINCEEDEPAPIPPIANDDGPIEVEENEERVPLGVLNNDVDPDGDDDDLEVYRIESGPNRGTVEINGDGSDILYTPDARICNKYTGQDTISDSFTYKIIDAQSLVSLNEATVTIRIRCNRERPNAGDSIIYINENESNVAVGALDNDNDPDNDARPSVKSIVDRPLNRGGTIKILDDGSDILYTPKPGICARYPRSRDVTDIFRYNVVDDQDDNLTSNTAKVTVKVVCNRTPTKKPTAKKSDNRKPSTSKKSKKSSSDDGNRKPSTAKKSNNRKPSTSKKSSSDGNRKPSSKPAPRPTRKPTPRPTTKKSNNRKPSTSKRSDDRRSDDRSTSKKTTTKKSRNDDRSRSDDRSSSKKNTSSKKYTRSNAQSAPSDVIYDAPTSEYPETFMDKYGPYIVIGIITILFNMIAYAAAYFCCIKQGMSSSSGHHFVETKVVEDSDDGTEDEEENEELNQDV